MDELTRDSLLKQLAENERLLEVIKRSLWDEADNIPIDLNDDNERLGAKVRARESVKIIVSNWCKNVKRLATKKEDKIKINPGR